MVWQLGQGILIVFRIVVEEHNALYIEDDIREERSEFSEELLKSFLTFHFIDELEIPFPHCLDEEDDVELRLAIWTHT